MTKRRSGPSALNYSSYSLGRSTKPKSGSRCGRLWRNLTFRTTCDARRRKTSKHVSFCSTRHQTLPSGTKTSRYTRHDSSDYYPIDECPTSGRRLTRAPTRTYGTSEGVSGYHLWKHRPPTDTTTYHSPPLNPTPLRSCMKGANGLRSCIPIVTSQRLSTERPKAETQNTKHTRLGQASTPPRYTYRRPSRKSHRREQDGWSRVRSFLTRSRNSPSCPRKKGRRTQALDHHKRQRDPKKERVHEHRGSDSGVFDSIHPRYTQSNRHRRIHEERSASDHEKGHERHTNREVTDRHTSHSVQKQKDTRPSMRCTEQRTTHRRAMHPSKTNDWYTAHTAHPRTHHSRAPSPGYRVIPTTRKTQGNWYR